MSTKRWITYYVQYLLIRLYRNPFLLSSIIFTTFDGWQGWRTVLYFIFAYFADTGLYFTLVYLACARQIERAVRFMDTFASGSALQRITTIEIARLVHPTRLPPFGPVPAKWREYLFSKHYHLLVAPRGGPGTRFSSPSAFPSPAGNENFIFVREHPTAMRPAATFRLLHEIGHTSSLGSAYLLREAVSGRNLWVFAVLSGPILIASNWLLAFFWIVAVQVTARAAIVEHQRITTSVEHQVELGADMFAADSLTPEDAAYLATEEGQFLLKTSATGAAADERRRLLKQFLETRASGQRLPVREFDNRLRETAYLALDHYIAIGVVLAISILVDSSQRFTVWWYGIAAASLVIALLLMKIRGSAAMHQISLRLEETDSETA